MNSIVPHLRITAPQPWLIYPSFPILYCQRENNLIAFVLRCEFAVNFKLEWNQRNLRPAADHVTDF
jgi:hypothetical protein